MANILVVDDAAFMRMMIKDILSKNGYNVVGEAENGAKAIDKFKELDPDLVIMDITMPEVDGIGWVDRDYTAMAPNGLAFSTMAGQTGGGKQVIGFLGVGVNYFRSPKFIQADGGWNRVRNAGRGRVESAGLAGHCGLGIGGSGCGSCRGVAVLVFRDRGLARPVSGAGDPRPDRAGRRRCRLRLVRAGASGNPKSEI